MEGLLWAGYPRGKNFAKTFLREPRWWDPRGVCRVCRMLTAYKNCCNEDGGRNTRTSPGKISVLPRYPPQLPCCTAMGYTIRISGTQLTFRCAASASDGGIDNCGTEHWQCVTARLRVCIHHEGMDSMIAKDSVGPRYGGDRLPLALTWRCDAPHAEKALQTCAPPRWWRTVSQERAVLTHLLLLLLC